MPTLTDEQRSAQIYSDFEQAKQRLGNDHPEADIVAALNSAPLGTLAGEANLQTPFNAPRRRPNVYVVNHSRTKVRRVAVHSVSSLSGAEEALRASKDYRTTYGNAENLYNAAKRRDLSIYEDKIDPCLFIVNFDGKKYIIPPASSEDPDNPPVEMIPEGAWDLYCGNYERTHAMKESNGRIITDDKTRGEEMVRLGLMWSRKHNPVWRIMDDGKAETKKNPFGFVEFIREVPKEAPQRIDGNFVSASELQEVE